MPLLLADEAFAVVGAAIEVHRELGSGFLEAVYQEALEFEFTQRQIPFIRQQPLPIRYKQTILNKLYIADLVCFDQIIVEIKAIQQLTSVEHAQLLNYLKATHKPLGILMNFHSRPTLEWKRLILSNDT
ncbi:GxxExxY protein [Herpetosiphon geysericola]|uniref:NADH:ubiquinone oxidoreductase n=1 Tax=Herpetosiphon geysericola TaxID=70996 RepID=A0A0P6XBY9_9CHLR|nr:GxxExxY protein [Herpetosiphon geysericola]KPL80310.1 NADH:ubiquinone oxidoreductase [Herpetosiphon geysericola]